MYAGSASKTAGCLASTLGVWSFHGDPHAGNIFAMDDGRPAAQIFAE